MAQTILSNLRLDRHTIERVSLLVEMHQRANVRGGLDRRRGPTIHARGRRRHRRSLALSAADVTTRRPERKRAAAERVEALQLRVAEIRAQEDVAKIASPSTAMS